MAKKKHPILMTVLLLVLLLVALLAMAPTLLSSDGARTRILQAINERAPGTVQLDAWQISWLQGIELQGLVYEQDKDDVVAHVERIRVEKSLLALLFDRGDLGKIEIHKPHLTSAIPEPLPDVEPTEPSEKPKTKGPRPKTGAGKKPVSSVEAITLPDLHVEVVIMDGAVDVVPAGQERTPLVRDVAVNVVMKGATAPITYDVKAKTGSGHNELTVRGETTLSKDGVLRVNDIASHTTLKVEAWDIEELLSLLSTFSNVPRGRGVLDARMELTGDLHSGMRATGKLALTELEVETLGEEVSLKRIDDIDLAVDGVFGGDSVKLDTLMVTSPFLHLSATGQYGGHEEGAFHATMAADLAQLSAMLIRVGAMTDDVSLQGGYTATIEGHTSGGLIVVDDALVTVSNLVFEQDGKSFQEDELVIHKRGSADLQKQTASLSLMDVRCSFGKIVVDTFEVKDLTRLPSTISLSGRLDLDLAKALERAGDYVELQPGVDVSGFVSSSVRVDVVDANRQRFELSGLISEFVVASTNGPPIREDEVGLKLKTVVTMNPFNVSLEELMLRSSIANVDTQGAYDRNADRHDLRVEGKTALDLARASEYLKAFTGLDVVMQGKGDKPFHMASSWEEGEVNGFWRNADLSAGFDAQQIQYLGVNVSDLSVPLRIAHGRAELSIEANVNEGRITAQPVVDLNPDTPVLSFADDATLMSDVKLTGEMANEMLAMLHPLFKGASVVGGTLKMHMNHFFFPLSQASQQDVAFKGTMYFNDLELGSSGMLYKLLESLRIRERSISVGDRDIDFECVNGRITCSTMKVKVDDYRILLSGSMGLDQTLNYVAEVPLTKELVGEEYYPYAEGLTFRVPIRGTVDKPELNMNALNDAIADLGRQATKKLIEEKAGDLLKDIFK